MKHRRLHLVPTLVALALGVLFIAGCGSSSEELDDARSTAANLTNELDKAKVRIAELEQTVRTALTNLTLVQNDLVSLSNRFVKVKTSLADAQGRWSIAETTANQRAARITELEGQARETVRLITGLREENARLEARFEQVNKEILNADAGRQAAVNERELLKARIVELEQLMNNATWLRSQYRRVKSAPSMPTPVTQEISAPGQDSQPAAPGGEVKGPAAFVPPRFRDMMEKPDKNASSRKTHLAVSADG